MINHRITYPERNEQGELVGWTHLEVVDHNGILNPEMTQDDLIHLTENIFHQFLRAGDNVNEEMGQNPELPIGMFIPQDQLPAVNEWLDRDGFKIEAPNEVRNLLAITANISTTIQPDLGQCNVKINILADYIPR